MWNSPGGSSKAAGIFRESRADVTMPAQKGKRRTPSPARLPRIRCASGGTGGRPCVAAITVVEKIAAREAKDGESIRYFHEILTNSCHTGAVNPSPGQMN
jgi:hypothetical protein